MRSWIGQRVLSWFRKKLPPLSAQEKAVLEAGDLWFEETFFTGKPHWKALFDLPKSCLSKEEQAFLQNEVGQLCALADDWKISHQQHDLSEAAWDFIKTHRFWGLTLSKEDGGHGFSALAHSSIIAKLATRSIALAYTVMVPNALGVSIFIKKFGTLSQKKQYLPRLARGEEISCFALTAPNAGSDAGSITDTGIVAYGEFEGSRVLGIRLNFDKRYITLAPVATLIGLAFQLYDPDGLLGPRKEYGISLVLLPTHLPGIQIGMRHCAGGLGFMNGPLRGQGVFIPIDYLIGGIDAAGRGWEMMLSCLALGRGISLPAVSSGIMQLALRASSAYAVIREQFNTSIGQFQGIQIVLARIAALSYCCEAVRRFTALAIVQGKHPSIAAAIAKYHLTEMARRVVADAIDLQGGAAVQLGPRNILANLSIATHLNTVVEGANILTRSLIIYGQGVLRCHPYLKKLIQASEENPKKFGTFLYKQIIFSVSSLFRGFWEGVTGGRFIRVGPHPYRKLLQQLTRMSGVLVVFTEFSLLVLGKHLKRNEGLSGRLGDLLSYLYLSASVLKHFEEGAKGAAEQALLEWNLTDALHQIARAIQEIRVNFPSRFLSSLLRWMLFPWGLRYNAPSDQLSEKIATFVQQDVALRSQLTALCYCDDKNSLIYFMDKALFTVLEGAPEAEFWRKAVIQVDEFKF